jgi:mannitol/fructose-specific phosphotransferase system IIA component (Ntr-type)
MKALLTALQEGRLVELPDNNKTDALKFLGALLEAVPEVSVDEDITEKALQRESAYSSAIGKGWACPHANTKLPGELLCAVGWCPAGIDFAAPDSLPVHLVVMYYVPDSQRHAYLKEISLLAKAINANSDLQHPQELTELFEIRHALLDAITHAIDSVTPDSMARMIRVRGQTCRRRIYRTQPTTAWRQNSGIDRCGIHSLCSRTASHRAFPKRRHQ